MSAGVLGLEPLLSYAYAPRLGIYRRFLHVEREAMTLPEGSVREELLRTLRRAKAELDLPGLGLGQGLLEELLSRCDPSGLALACAWASRGQKPLNLIATDFDETLRFRRETEAELPPPRRWASCEPCWTGFLSWCWWPTPRAASSTLEACWCSF